MLKKLFESATSAVVFFCLSLPLLAQTQAQLDEKANIAVAEAQASVVKYNMSLAKDNAEGAKGWAITSQYFCNDPVHKAAGDALMEEGDDLWDAAEFQRTSGLYDYENNGWGGWYFYNLGDLYWSYDEEYWYEAAANKYGIGRIKYNHSKTHFEDAEDLYQQASAKYEAANEEYEQGV